MNHMINTSLVIHQIEIGSYVQNGMLLDVTKPISYVVRELLPTCTAKGVTVEFYVQGEMYTDKLYVFLCADEYLFASVIENLLKNAVEASPSGKQVVVSVYYEDRFFYIKIENYGVVPESIRHIFFNKYVTCNKYGGTGIGTYSAKLMAEAMGGDVELDTSIEEKTIITVWLPKPNLDM
jgi:signal transduction histidine kinase